MVLRSVSSDLLCECREKHAVKGKEPLLRVGTLRATFRVRSGCCSTISSISFDLRGGRVLTVMKRSNYKGDALTAAVIKLRGGIGAQVSKRVVCRGLGLVSLGRALCGHVEKGSVKVIFRSPLSTLGPLVAIDRRVRRILLCRSGVAGRRHRLHIYRLLARIGISSPGTATTHCPRRLS